MQETNKCSTKHSHTFMLECISYVKMLHTKLTACFSSRSTC